jgi:hypothetical protein
MSQMNWTTIEEPNSADTAGFIDGSEVVFVTRRFNFGSVEEPVDVFDRCDAQTPRPWAGVFGESIA